MNNHLKQKHPIPWWAGIAVFFLLVGAVLSFTIFLSILVHVTGNGDLVQAIATPFGLVIQVFFMSGILAAIALLLPHFFGVEPRGWLGLVPAGTGVTLAAALGVVGLGFLVDQVTYLLHSLNPSFFTTSGLDMFNHMFVDASPAVFIILTLTVSMGPGVGEELFFRGFVMRSFLQRMSPFAAVLTSSVMFGLIHFDKLQSPGAGLIGVYLGFVALRTGSLWPAMIAHALNNLLCALFARFTPSDATPLWESGHSPAVLAAAAAITGVAIYVVVKKTQNDEPIEIPTGDPEVPPQLSERAPSVEGDEK